MTTETNEIHQIVRDHYAAAAIRATTTGVSVLLWRRLLRRAVR